ncbi:response regulator [Blautia glucerasea]|uniref:response regulator n=1 Tax=Blautia glucerasea TaxID=536633 RepID=UPI001D00FDDC|nr:response regulator [Blautia glucerasea]MCB5386418.1 response regulator [Blautia glucerasea]MCB5420773.1 response regulator [Blautia luti]
MYRVLITDDEKIEREGIKFLLAQEEGEYEIHEAANGRQALNVLRSKEIDFLLTDIKMPHMDGLELAGKAREEYPNLPIVIFSGYSDFAFAQEAMHYGVNDYVLKPVDPDTFHKKNYRESKSRAPKYPISEAEGREGEEFPSSVFSSDLPVFWK